MVANSRIHTDMMEKFSWRKMGAINVGVIDRKSSALLKKTVKKIRELEIQSSLLIPG